MARKALRVASALLVAAGLAVLVSLNASDVVARYEANMQISRAESRYESASDGERANLVRQARLYNEGLAGDDAKTSLPYERQLCFSGEPVMGSLEIPAIEVRLPIYHGTGDGELMSGVGHLEVSSLPIGGKSTHCVLFGHSGMENTRMLDGLEKLHVGDVFIVWALNVAHAYEI